MNSNVNKYLNFVHLMRSTLALLLLSIFVLSCGKRDQGELIGVKTKKFIRVNPHGMVKVPGGSLLWDLQMRISLMRKMILQEP